MFCRPFFQLIPYKALEVLKSCIRPKRSKFLKCTQYGYRITLFIAAIIFGFSLYFRTTNMWALKNLGDSFLIKYIGQRPIVIGAFHRPLNEKNVKGAYAVCNLLIFLIFKN